VRKVFSDSRGRLWVGTWRGLALAEVKSDDSVVFHRFTHDENDKTSLSNNQVMSIIEDHKGRIWVGTRGGGINMFNEKNSSFVSYRHSKTDQETISGDDVCVLYEDRKNRFWVGTFSEGLNLFDVEKGAFTRIYTNPDDPMSLLSNNVYSIFEDNSGLLWIGAGGLNILDTRMELFGRYRHNRRDEKSLSNNTVTGFYEDNTGVVWIGTEGGGLNRFDRNNGFFTSYKNSPPDRFSIKSNSISAVTGNDTGKLWIATGAGLELFDKSSGRFTVVKDIPGVPGNDALKYINYLCFTSKDHLWMATDNAGLIDYHLSINKAVCFNSSQKNERYFPGNSLLSLYHGSDSILWIGTWGIGLYSMDISAGHIKANPFDTLSLVESSGNIVHVICETVDSIGKTIWAGTSSGLIYTRIDGREKGVCKRIAMEQGLPGNIVYGILQDNDGFLWISTNRGLSRLDTKNGNIRNFDVNDGLQSNEFSGHVCLKLKDGNLLFGGVNGFNMFNPENIIMCNYQPNIVLTEFKVFNKGVSFNKALYEVQSIDLTYKQNFFSFEFAALDFAKPEKIRYRYKMSGVDPDWVNSGNRHYVSYTNVAPGEYVFQVKATNRDGVFTDKLLSINITIKPPYWQTWWFRSIIFVVVMLILYGLHRLRVEKLLAIEKLRVRIASDLHDDIGSSLTRISITSEQIQNIDDKTKIRLLSKKIGDTSREIVSTMSDIVWSIDSRNDSLNDLLDRMHDLVYKSLVMKDIKVSFKSSGFEENKKISVDKRQNLFYIFKEVINNIVKHSEADEVKIVLKNSDTGFYMEISDNGKSFNVDNSTRGNGLRNIRMRAGRLNAKIDFMVSDGVKVILVMKRV
jgi:ligand-binding sensor domain-containing protein/two-component sensor histidine kinase